MEQSLQKPGKAYNAVINEDLDHHSMFKKVPYSQQLLSSTI